MMSASIADIPRRIITLWAKSLGKYPFVQV